jgi:hypothetical protein
MPAMPERVKSTSTVKQGIDQAVSDVLDAPARHCRPDDPCRVCLREIREEAFQWLREIADSAPPESELHFRAWELHIGGRK